MCVGGGGVQNVPALTGRVYRVVQSLPGPGGRHGMKNCCQSAGKTPVEPAGMGTKIMLNLTKLLYSLQEWEQK